MVRWIKFYRYFPVNSPLFTMTSRDGNRTIQLSRFDVSKKFIQECNLTRVNDYCSILAQIEIDNNGEYVRVEKVLEYR